MRRLAAVAGTVLLSGATLAGGAGAARAAAPPTSLPGGFSFHVLGGFHLKRLATTDGKAGTALLFCSSVAVGSGPEQIHGVGDVKDPTAACEELAAVNGAFDTLNVHPTWMAPALMAPVHVEAHGTWQGTKVDWAHDFTNDGWLAKKTGDVFAF